MLIAAITFVGVLSVIFGAYWFTIGEPEAREQQKLRRRLKSESPQRARSAASVQLLKQETAFSNISALNALLNSIGGLSVPLQNFVSNSGLPLTVGSFLLLTGVTFLAAALLVRSYLPIVWVIVPAALAAA